MRIYRFFIVVASLDPHVLGLREILVFSAGNKDNTSGDDASSSNVSDAGHRANKTHKNSKQPEGHRTSLLHTEYSLDRKMTHVEKISSTLGHKARRGHKVQLAVQTGDEPKSLAIEAIIACVVFIVGICTCIVVRRVRGPTRQEAEALSKGKDHQRPRERQDAKAAPSVGMPSSSGDRHGQKQDDSKNVAAESSSSSDEDEEARPTSPKTDDANISRVQTIEQASKRLATTCMKLPRQGGGMLGVGGAKARFICMKPAAHSETDSWSVKLKAWRHGKLGYWIDEKAFRSGSEPKGTINLLDITKLNIPEKQKTQVSLKHKENGQDQHLILQFPDPATAIRWRDSFKELRTRL